MRQLNVSETKEHYKSYKAGKRWVYACLTVAALGLGTLGVTTTANAATTSDPAVETTQSSEQPASSEKEAAGDPVKTDGQTTEPETKQNETKPAETPAPTKNEDSVQQDQPETTTEPANTVTSEKKEVTQEPEKPVVASAPAQNMTRMAKIAPRETAPSVVGQDASEWMPDAGLRTWIEGDLSQSQGEAVTDANLSTYLDHSLNLDTNDSSYPTATGVASFEGLQYFTNLTSFRATDPQISADSLPDFSFAPNLRFFTYLGDNQHFTDAAQFMKDHLIQNTALTNLALNYSLQGSFPDLSAYQKLETINFSNNQLTGTLPDLGNLPVLDRLDVENNQMSGTLPNFGNWPVLNVLNISNNDFSGALPDLKNFKASDFREYYNQLSSGLLTFYNDQGQASDNYSWYQFLNGKTYNLFGTDQTFDPLTGVVAGIQDMKTGQIDPSENFIVYGFSKGAWVVSGDWNDAGSKANFLNWAAGQSSATADFVKVADPTNPLGFNLIASPDTPAGTYTLGIMNENYDNDLGGYVGFITFKITHDAPVTPVTPVDPTPSQQTGTVTIVEVDQQGKTLHQRTMTGKVGDTYTAQADQLAGYKVTGKSNVSGSYTAAGDTVTFTYATVDNGGDGDQVLPDKPATPTKKDQQAEVKGNGGQAAEISTPTKSAKAMTATVTPLRTQQSVEQTKDRQTVTLPQTNEQRTLSPVVLGLVTLLTTLGLGGWLRRHN
ncbi:MucBP domain-containing protein [Levilactobacillus humaensis]|uniref:MucBP domain-containing protein n=1 Tax=Levilactobacillus humaensis TaxID=2950375 RepID=UPI0021C3B7D9|nr:MucBP domain-containing protein [Levilactobacillus humaensis]